MKKKELKGLLNVLGLIPVTKIEPRELASRLVKLIIALNRESAAINAEIESLKEQYVKPNEARMQEYANAVQNHKDLAPYKKEMEIDALFSAAFNGIMEEEIELTEKFSVDELLSAMADAGTVISGKEVGLLTPLFN